jgi:selenocysteine-specific elongation factor
VVNTTLTIGVVGHVDHGKTALVRALTGIETDRLREERERGLSIVLGFAYLEADGRVVDLIDVPGHEDFIRAMISGATGLDGIMLCVAANEGVMPQTVEHFRIAELLGIERGFVVLTKTDLVDAETLALAREEVGDFLCGSFLEAAPVLEVSAIECAGLDAVRMQLLAMAELPREDQQSGAFFLPLDRVFAMRGFGIVGTGTLRGGVLAAGDTVEILPSGYSATVRALQNHGHPTETAVPGQRVAVNLRQISRNELERGDVLASPGYLQPTQRLDGSLRLVADAAPLKHRASVRFSTGTTEVMATVSLLDCHELKPGATALVQIHLARALATQVMEYFLLRSASPIHTIGGGKILALHPERHRRFGSAVRRRLEALEIGDLDEIIRQRLEDQGRRGVDLAALAQDLGTVVSDLEQRARRFAVIAIGEDRVVAASAYSDLLDEIVAALERSHEKEPFKIGLDPGSLCRELLSVPDAGVFRHAVRDLSEQGRIDKTDELLRLPGHDPFARLDPEKRRLVETMELEFLAHGLEPPPPQSLVGEGKAAQTVFRLLLDSGRLVRLKTYKNDSELVLHAHVLENAQRRIASEFPHPAGFALKDIRDLLGSTRKFIVPLMEHLDATGTTVRSGDVRRLRA